MIAKLVLVIICIMGIIRAWQWINNRCPQCHTQLDNNYHGVRQKWQHCHHCSYCTYEAYHEAVR